MRKTCLMVLSHLILNDMMKVKGHIARLALCLQDGDPRVAGLAQVFFHELSRKAFKVGQATRKLYGTPPSSTSCHGGQACMLHGGDLGGFSGIIKAATRFARVLL